MTLYWPNTVFDSEHRKQALRDGQFEIDTDTSLANGLKGFWPLGLHAGDKDIDYSHNANHGDRESGVVRTVSRHPKLGAVNAVQFGNPANDEIEAQLSIDEWPEVSLGAWVKLTSADNGGSNDYIISFAEGASANGLDIGQDGTNWRYDLVTHGGASLNTPGTTNTDWNFLAATYDGATFKGFLNGVEVVNDSITGTVKNALGTGCFGSLSIGSKFEAYCELCFVTIHDRALTDSECDELCHRPEQLIKPRSKTTVFDITAAAGGFSPFWANQATRISPTINLGAF